MYGLKYGKGVVHCSLCGEQGHNITSCKKVDEIYNNATYEIRTHYEDGTPLPQQVDYWVKLKNWNKVSMVERRAFVEMERRITRKANRKKITMTKKRKKSRCSFCRKEGHRRPNCKHKDKFTKIVYKANNNWRKGFTNFINQAGLGIGALVRIPRQTFYWGHSGSGVMLGLIMDYDLDSMNVCASYEHRDSFTTSPQMTIVDTLDGKEYKLPLHKIKDFVVENRLIKSLGWGGYTTVDVVSPVEWEPPLWWLDEESNKELEFLISSISVNHHSFANIYKLMLSWSKEDENE